jgi:hypothetical protein
LWYHPNITDEELDQLKAWGCSNVTNAKTMASVRTKWDKVWTPELENYSPNYGFCGGKEKLIAEFFWGEPIIGAEFDQYEWLHSKRFPRNYEGHEESLKRSVDRTELHFVYGRRVSDIYWRSVAHRVGRPHIAKNTLGQYLFDHAMTFDCSEDDRLQSVVSWAATLVLQRHKIPPEVLEDELSVQALDEVEALYRNGKFSASYQKVWEDVECGKIDREIR